MQDTHRIQETYPQEGIDSKAYLLCFLRRIPYMLLIGLTGAIIQDDCVYAGDRILY